MWMLVKHQQLCSTAEAYPHEFRGNTSQFVTQNKILHRLAFNPNIHDLQYGVHTEEWCQNTGKLRKQI